MIRQAETGDISRIAEILVFTKRVNYRRIFHNDRYSFGELQVMTVAGELQQNPGELREIWVYEEDFVKGMIRVRGQEVVQLYVDSFFAGQLKWFSCTWTPFSPDRASEEHFWTLRWNVFPSRIYGCWKAIPVPSLFMSAMAFIKAASGNTKRAPPNVCCGCRGKKEMSLRTSAHIGSQ